MALPSYLWELKKKASEIPKLTWSILKIVPVYSNISKRCFSCLQEKLYIAIYHDQELLNKRSKSISKCRHENKFLLANYKANDQLLIVQFQYLHIIYNRNIQNCASVIFPEDRNNVKLEVVNSVVVISLSLSRTYIYYSEVFQKMIQRTSLLESLSK